MLQMEQMEMILLQVEQWEPLTGWAQVGH